MAYTAVVLDGASQRALLDQVLPQVPEAEGWTPFAHHMTINMGPFNPKLNNPELLGQQLRMQVTHIGVDTLVCAVRVTCGIRTVNDTEGEAGKHITLAVNKVDGGKPFFSNKISAANWTPTQTPLVLVGTVQEVPR